MKYLSPLRYPGGKAKLAPFFQRVCAAQEEAPTEYAEPFAGGAGAALRLLTDGSVDRIHLNDINPGIASFWRGVFTETERFTEKIRTTEATLENWHKARAIYTDPEGADRFELGFATFFLNRTNRSGILTARPIGGLDQKGAWKIDARYNAEGLVKRIENIAAYRDQVEIYEQDALAFLTQMENRDSRLFVYVDPPYIQQGEDLYMQVFGEDAHTALAQRLRTTDLKWVLTYDQHKSIPTTLYGGLPCAAFGIAHTAQLRHIGKEFAVFSPQLHIPDLQILPNRAGQYFTAPIVEGA